MYEYEYVFYVCMADTVPLKRKYHKKMFPKFCQWIPSPKYIDLKKL